MYAALMTLSIDPKKAPQAAAAFTEKVLPKVQSARGFVSGFWVDPVKGHGFGFLLFETEKQAARVAKSKSNWKAPGIKILNVDIRRVAVSIP